jgi:hypothetical protein
MQWARHGVDDRPFHRYVERRRAHGPACAHVIVHVTRDARAGSRDEW